jgi:hypothetical protein
LRSLEAFRIDDRLRDDPPPEAPPRDSNARSGPQTTLASAYISLLYLYVHGRLTKRRFRENMRRAVFSPIQTVNPMQSWFGFTPCSPVSPVLKILPFC